MVGLLKKGVTSLMMLVGLLKKGVTPPGRMSRSHLVTAYHMSLETVEAGNVLFFGLECNLHCHLSTTISFRILERKKKENGITHREGR